MYRREFERWLEQDSLTKEEQLRLVEIRNNDELVEDLFGRDLKFGTAGLRGKMDVGTNRMNNHVVKRATQGVSQFLLKRKEDPSVVIGYDTRNHSEDFAREAACVLAANGIKVYLFDQYSPVPLVSFATRSLKTDAAIMITASHNPKEYNGYKVYNGTGGQILEEEADSILEEISNIDIFSGVKTVDFEAAIGNEIVYTPDYVYENFLSNASQVSKGNLENNRNLKVVYSPLHGSGRSFVNEILNKNGFDFEIVKEQEEADGNFPTCPSPNPENRDVYDIALRYADREDADLIIATDPDADRLGAMVRDREGYTLLTGNEIGILMFYYLCCRGQAEGKNLVSTIVSTPLVDAIAEDYKVNVIRTHVGFKYIGEQIDIDPDNFLLGFEESNGYLAGTYARDKDAVFAANLFCSLAAYFKAEGKTLPEVLEEIYSEYGFMINETISIKEEKREKIEQLMNTFRDAEAMKEVFSDIISYTDYNSREYNKELPLADVVQYGFSDGSGLVIRPSGTEPKIKVYVSAKGSTAEMAEEKIAKIRSKVMKLAQ